MDAIIKELSSPTFWFGAVFVGFLINMAAAYAKPWFDRRLESTSTWWTRRSSAAREAFEKQAASIARDPLHLAIVQSQIVIDVGWAIFMLVQDAVLLGFLVLETFWHILDQPGADAHAGPRAIGFAAALIIFIVAFINLHAAQKRVRLLFAARRIRIAGVENR